MSRRRRRFQHEGVYFAETSGLRAALIDAGQLTLCLRDLMRVRGLLDAELVPVRGSGRHAQPSGSAAAEHSAVTVHDGFEALESAYRVFSDCASVVERVWQAQEQVGLVLDAAAAAGGDSEAVRWLEAHELVRRISDDDSPVRQSVLTAARAALKARERKKARGSGGDGKGG